MPCAAEAFRAARVIDEGGLEALGGGDGDNAGDDAGGHAGGKGAEGGEGVSGWVGEEGVESVEGQEAEAVFGDGAEEEGREAGVEGAGAGVLDRVGDKVEGVFRGWGGGGVGAELGAGFGEFERVLEGTLLEGCSGAGELEQWVLVGGFGGCMVLTVQAASTAPAVPPAIKETMGGILESFVMELG